MLDETLPPTPTPASGEAELLFAMGALLVRRYLPTADDSFESRRDAITQDKQECEQ